MKGQRTRFGTYEVRSLGNSPSHQAGEGEGKITGFDMQSQEVRFAVEVAKCKIAV